MKEETSLKLTANDLDKTIAKIKNHLGKIEKGYITIAGDVAKLRDTKSWTDKGFKNLYELCQEEFGMSRGTVHNLCTIYDKYGDGNYKLPDNGMTVREMLREIQEEKQLAKKDVPEISAKEMSENDNTDMSDKVAPEDMQDLPFAEAGTEFNVEFTDVKSAQNFLSNDDNTITRVVIYYNK